MLDKEKIEELTLLNKNQYYNIETEINKNEALQEENDKLRETIKASKRPTEACCAPTIDYKAEYIKLMEETEWLREENFDLHEGLLHLALKI